METLSRHRAAPSGRAPLAALVALATLLGGCGAGSGDGLSGARASGGAVIGGSCPTAAAASRAVTADYPADGECSLTALRGWVDASMRDYYLFSDRVPSPRPQDFDSPDALLDALRVDPPDRYSYLGVERDYDALFEAGETFGFGWRLARTDETTWRFALVEPGSPLAMAGVRRGDRLVAINGLSVPEFVAQPETEQDRQLGVPSTPACVDFEFERAVDGGRFGAAVTSGSYRLETVPEGPRVVEHAGARVGYLPFTQFLETSNAELEIALGSLSSSAIDELVLDLRFNGGGRIDVASALAAAIGGRAIAGETFAALRYNARYAPSLDADLGFIERFARLDLARLVVLTSAGTCSASELLINGLEPFVDVVAIGAPSCGKPFGTAPNRRCGRVLNALEVAFENARGVGAYTEGLAVDCPVVDVPRGPLGQRGDALWEAALGYIASGSCPSGATTLAADPRIAVDPDPRARGSSPTPLPDPLERRDPLRESAVLR